MFFISKTKKIFNFASTRKYNRYDRRNNIQERIVFQG